jgi:hypothetical protein
MWNEPINSVIGVQTRPRQGSNHVGALLYKVEFTWVSRESTPCESEIDEVGVREVDSIVSLVYQGQIQLRR